MIGRWLLMVGVVACLPVDPVQLRSLPVDADGDGFASVASGGADCDDLDLAINPGQGEICGDGIDNNCDGRTDDGGRGSQPVYEDADGDGWGTGKAFWACPGRLAAMSRVAEQRGDCDDTRAEINPGAEDVCNGVDDDCDGERDEDEIATGPGSRFGSLEEAIQEARTIELCPSLQTVEVRSTILVDLVARTTEIRGPGADRLTLVAPSDQPLLELSAGRLVIEGVTFQGGAARTLVVSDDGVLELESVVMRESTGGAVLVHGGSAGSQPVFRATATQFFGNGHIWLDGGAIRATEGFRIELVESELLGNIGNLGGGLAAVWAPPAGPASYGDRVLVVEDSLIAGNEAVEGGGVYLNTVTAASFPSTLISGNEADTLGGGMALYGTTVSGDPATDVAGNQAERGGGVFLHNAGVESLRIGNNVASEHGGGVTMAGRAGYSSVFDAIVHDNEAVEVGGGVYVGSGLPAFLSATRVRGNRAGSGGGVYLNVAQFSGFPTSTLDVSNCSFGGAKNDNEAGDIVISNGSPGWDESTGRLVSVRCTRDECVPE